MWNAGGRHPWWCAVACLVIGGWAIQATESWASDRAAAVNVTLHEILERPGDYDGRLVIVSGFVAEIEAEVGRRGSEYAVLTLDGTPVGSELTPVQITVIAPRMRQVQRCDYVVVRGVFRRSGKQAGRSYDLFVVADLVRSTSPTGVERVPAGCEERI